MPFIFQAAHCCSSKCKSVYFLFMFMHWVLYLFYRCVVLWCSFFAIKCVSGNHVAMQTSYTLCNICWHHTNNINFCHKNVISFIAALCVTIESLLLQIFNLPNICTQQRFCTIFIFISLSGFSFLFKQKSYLQRVFNFL